MAMATALPNAGSIHHSLSSYRLSSSKSSEVGAIVFAEATSLQADTLNVKTGSDRKPESERTLLDNASNLLTNLLSRGDMGTMPIAEGTISDLSARPFFFALYDWFIEHGYKLAFGLKAFVGVLADILEPIMGKGLIPADLETWKVRRRATVPGFHAAAYLDAMVQVFDNCVERTVEKFDRLLDAAQKEGKS